MSCGASDVTIACAVAAFCPRATVVFSEPKFFARALLNTERRRRRRGNHPLQKATGRRWRLVRRLQLEPRRSRVIAAPERRPA
jgi:hypothetical protein